MVGVGYFCWGYLPRAGWVVNDCNSDTVELMGLIMGEKVGAPCESYTLYTSWLGLMGERRSTGAPRNGAVEYSYVQDMETGRGFVRTESPSACRTLYSSWLGFDGLEDAKASDQTADSLTAVQSQTDQPKADPYILYCIG
jgi:hypothetical protein